MVQPKPVEMMDVEVLVEPALLVKSAAEEPVSVLPTVPEDSAEMMVAEECLVDLALQLKPAKTVSVQELLLQTVPEDNVEITELGETVETAQLVNDAELESVSATMIVMKEIVEMQDKPKQLILVSALKDHVELALQDSLVEPMDVVLLKHPVTFSLQWSIVPLDVLCQPAVQS